MTTITAKIVAHSTAAHGKPIATMLLRYPRPIHSELLTHRVFSRNASSSRAIPVARLIQDVLDDPYIPLHWGKNEPGMQAREQHDEPVILNDELPRFTNGGAWLMARDSAVRYARAFAAAGYHKQIVNRLLEPFAHINVVVTSTEWSNFFALRQHEDAEPHIKLLADAMFEALEASTPRFLKPGEWHLPFVTMDDNEVFAYGLKHDIPGPKLPELAVKLSVARCARTSYLTHEGKAPDIDKDLELYARLVGAVPLHASPAEHQATPDEEDTHPYTGEAYWTHEEEHGNFVGWRQFRKMLPGENQ